MHEAIRTMLARYQCNTQDDYINALREILQEIALLGLWRGKFFEHAAFYGGTALRILHGLDRYSEDLDFSLIQPNDQFSLGAYGDALCKEIRSFGFQVEFETRRKPRRSAIDSAFLKTNTWQQSIVMGVPKNLLSGLHPSKKLKIRLEIDTCPPGGFETETKYVLLPIPFSVRVYRLPDLFAGKMHAILCRKWKNRVKGRDWYDLVWYVARDSQLHLGHLENRMRQSGDYTEIGPLTSEDLKALLGQALDRLNLEQARQEVASYIKDPRSLDVWSKNFFRGLFERIELV